MEDANNREAESVGRIEATRRVMRIAMNKCAERGAAKDEVAIGAFYAVFDIAELHAGPEQSAIEWLRSCCDVVEQGLRNGQPRQA